jgi:hypothetical protein
MYGSQYKKKDIFKPPRPLSAPGPVSKSKGTFVMDPNNKNCLLPIFRNSYIDYIGGKDGCGGQESRRYHHSHSNRNVGGGSGRRRRIGSASDDAIHKDRSKGGNKYNRKDRGTYTNSQHYPYQDNHHQHQHQYHLQDKGVGNRYFADKKYHNITSYKSKHYRDTDEDDERGYLSDDDMDKPDRRYKNRGTRPDKTKVKTPRRNRSKQQDVGVGKRYSTDRYTQASYKNDKKYRDYYDHQNSPREKISKTRSHARKREKSQSQFSDDSDFEHDKFGRRTQRKPHMNAQPGDHDYSSDHDWFHDANGKKTKRKRPLPQGRRPIQGILVI